MLGTLTAELACFFGSRRFTNASHPGFRMNLHRICLVHHRAYVEEELFGGRMLLRSLCLFFY